MGDAILGGDPEFDDIFLLRFVLTWEKRGGLSKAVDAVKQTVAFRRANKATLDEVCRPGGKAPNEDKVCYRFHVSIFLHSCVCMSRPTLQVLGCADCV